MQKDKIKTITNIFVVSLGVSLVIFIGLRVLYPINYFDSTKNNMTVAKVVLENEKAGYLYVAPQIEHNFYSAKITMTPSAKLDFDRNIDVFKGFVAQLYPLGVKIETAKELREFIFSNDKEIPNGSLVSAKDAVYVYSRGKWRPFLGAQIFENLKFDWDRVTPLKNDYWNSFEEGERIIFRTTHPDGTIFKTNNNNFFLLWEEKLLPIKNEALIESVWKDYYAVKIEEKNPLKIGECKQVKFSKNLDCTFLKEYRTKEITGNVFIFPLGEHINKFTDSKITLSSFNIFDIENPKTTLSFNKQRIIEKYSQEILE